MKGFVYDKSFNGNPKNGADVALLHLSTAFERTGSVQQLPLCSESQESSTKMKIKAIGHGIVGYENNDLTRPIQSNNLKVTTDQMH